MRDYDIDEPAESFAAARSGAGGTAPLPASVDPSQISGFRPHAPALDTLMSAAHGGLNGAVDRLHGGAIGLSGHAGINASLGDASVDAKADLRSGAEAKGYRYDTGDKQGYAGDASVTGLGASNIDANASLGGHSAHLKADEAYLNKTSVGGNYSRSKDGTVAADGKFSSGSGAENLDVKAGDTSVAAKKAFYGTDVQAGGSYNSKTGGEVHAKGFSGAGADDVKVSTKTGVADLDAEAKRVQYGYEVEGKAGYDKKTGLASLDGSGRGGGFKVEDAKAKGKVAGLGDVNAKMGEISNDVIVKDVHAEADSKHAQAKIGTFDWGGVRMSNADFKSDNKQLGLKTEAGFESLGSNNTLTNAQVDANFESLEKAKLKASIGELGYSGWSGTNLKAGVHGPGDTNIDAKVGSFGMTPLSVKNASVEANLKDGVKSHIDNLDYSDFSLKGVNAKANIGQYADYHAKLGELATNRTSIEGANQSLNSDGFKASLKKGSYDAGYVKGLDSGTNVKGVYEQNLKIGEGQFNHLSADNVHAGLTMSQGLTAGLENGNYRYLAGKDLETKTNLLGGKIGAEAKIGEASVGGVDVGKLDAKFGLEKGHLDIDKAGAHGLKAKDIDAKQNIGAAGANMKAKELDLADASVEKAKLETSDYYTKASAEVDNAKLTGINAKDAHAGLSWNGKELAGATGSFNSSTGVEQAKADYDLKSGHAGASFKNANFGAQLSDTSINIGDTKIAIPNMGGKVNASGDADVDLFKGAAKANVGLGGSSVNFGGQELTVPEWVKAGGGVDVSKGAANVNVGGDSGVGADVNLSEGKLAINAFGNKIDVGQGVKNVASSVADTASSVKDTISDGASKAWGALTSLF